MTFRGDERIKNAAKPGETIFRFSENAGDGPAATSLCYAVGSALLPYTMLNRGTGTMPEAVTYNEALNAFIVSPHVLREKDYGVPAGAQNYWERTVEIVSVFSLTETDEPDEKASAAPASPPSSKKTKKGKKNGKGGEKGKGRAPHYEAHATLVATLADGPAGETHEYTFHSPHSADAFRPNGAPRADRSQKGAGLVRDFTSEGAEYLTGLEMTIVESPKGALLYGETPSPGGSGMGMILYSADVEGAKRAMALKSESDWKSGLRRFGLDWAERLEMSAAALGAHKDKGGSYVVPVPDEISYACSLDPVAYPGVSRVLVSVFPSAKRDADGKYGRAALTITPKKGWSAGPADWNAVKACIASYADPESRKTDFEPEEGRLLASQFGYGQVAEIFLGKDGSVGISVPLTRPLSDADRLYEDIGRLEELGRLAMKVL